jgi:hypothetical protein
MTDTTPQHPDPAVSADDNHGADVPTEEAAGAPAEALDPAHGPVPDGSPLSAADPIGRAAGTP